MNKHNQKHLTISDRIYIEQELIRGSSFKTIAAVLRKDPTTISKEVKRARTLIPHNRYAKKCKLCHFYNECSDKNMCTKNKRYPNFYNCRFFCKQCSHWSPQDECSNYLEFTCNQCNKAPYVCNSCSKNHSCILEHYIYDAKKAQRLYEKTLSESRKGINMTPEDLQKLNDLISPLILKGQPLSHIFAVHADEIPVCRRTLYNYLDQRVFQARNIDLPRRVRYKKRKKKTITHKRKNMQQTYRIKRTFIDFERFMKAHPELDVVEMDTVKGGRDKGKCLLTFLFRSCSFMIVILMPDCTQHSVIKAINDLTEALGIRTFKKYFPVILTDYAEENTMPKFL